MQSHSHNSGRPLSVFFSLLDLELDAYKKKNEVRGAVVLLSCRCGIKIVAIVALVKSSHRFS